MTHKDKQKGGTGWFFSEDELKLHHFKDSFPKETPSFYHAPSHLSI